MKNSFCFGCRWISRNTSKAKLESAYSFMLKYSKITVWSGYCMNKLAAFDYFGGTSLTLLFLDVDNFWENSYVGPK